MKDLRRTLFRGRVLSATVVGLVVLLLATNCGRQDGPPSSVKGLHVPDGFAIEEAVPAGMVKYPMFASLDSTGRLFVVESSGRTTSTEDVLKNPTFLIRLLEDTDDDGLYDKSAVFADSLPYPMGGTFYHGSFYTAVPPDLLKLTDHDGDGRADQREIVLTGWTLSHNAATLSGPFLGPDGWMYLCDARRGFDIVTKEGARLKGKTARIWRCRPDGSGLESVSTGGFDNTIELIFMPSGETIGTMTYFTDPEDGMRDALMHWVEGGVYPKPFPAIEEDNLKLTGDLMPVMTKLSRVSHAGLMRYRTSSFGKEYSGNLFSAEFNTGRLMRHIISSDGATYQTRTEEFMGSEIPDFHPTDVLEDADGSVLFVNTGGWFIAGCPLSVVAKTDVHGGIYRIRKTSASGVDDARGKKLAWDKLTGQELVSLTGDSRPAVRDNAFEQLIARGRTSLTNLDSLLKSAGNEETRAAAVFALYRIGSNDAMATITKAFDDESVVVRTAACRVAGLAKDKNSVQRLMAALADNSAQVRRQAATALGQIGDEQAIGPLLSVADKNADRFVEHAVIFSLINIGSTQPLLDALEHDSEGIRAAALVALDQIDANTLSRSDISKFLQTQNPKLEKTAIWVLRHHPAWADLVVELSRKYFDDRAGSTHDMKLITDLIIDFSREKAVQQSISDGLRSGRMAVDNKLVLLDVISRSPLETFPPLLTSALEELLEKQDPLILSKTLDVISSRRIQGVEGKLLQVAQNVKLNAPLKLKALSAKIALQPDLTDTEFQTLLDFLQPQYESTVRQSATRAIAMADLSDAQLTTLANDHIRTADIYLLNGLVDAFEGIQSEEAGLSLVAALSSSPERLDNVSLPQLTKLMETAPSKVREAATPLLKNVEGRQLERLAKLQAIEDALTNGDIGEGRRLFYGKALCSTCHAIAGNGAKFGPDLTNIGEIRSQHDILEAIVYPDASFAREYETSRVVTGTAAHNGIVKEQLPASITMETGPGVVLRIPSSDIRSVEALSVSLMPSGLNKQLTTEELSDLMTFLRSLPDGLAHVRKPSAE